MPVDPAQPLRHLTPHRTPHRPLPHGLFDTHARDQHSVDDIGDGIDGDRQRRPDQAHQSPAESWTGCLPDRVRLIESRVRRAQCAPLDDQRQQGLGRREAEDRERTERQKQHNEHPELQQPRDPQHGYQREAQRAAQTRPHEHPLTPPAIDVHAGEEPEKRVRNELRCVHDPDLERARTQHADHQNRQCHRGQRGPERARPRSPRSTERTRDCGSRPSVRYPSPDLPPRLPTRSHHPIDPRAVIARAAHADPGPSRIDSWMPPYLRQPGGRVIEASSAFARVPSHPSASVLSRLCHLHAAVVRQSAHRSRT